MQYDPTRVSEAFQRLFQTYPSFLAGDADESLRVYFEAVEPYELLDIEAAVANFLRGSAPGHNPAFAPPAPQVAAEVRRIMHLRLDSEARAKKPMLPPPDIAKDDASRERVREAMARAVDDLAATKRTEDAAASRRASERQSKLDDRFTPDMRDDAVARRLRFTAGDPDGDRDIA